MSWSVPGYVERKELGRGASGRVVLAEHEGTGTKVAIKYLADHLSQDPDFIEAFRAEARILAEVEDPQIARLYEYLEGPEGSAIVMELVDGVALRAILREHGPTEPQSALVVLKGSLLGLAAAHSRGIVHRDYKPENVLVDQTGHSKLADFGIAARTGLKGAHAGTPSYMAPEQWVGAAASPSTDIYAATATFFECLTGHAPYRAPGDLLGLRAKHEEAPIPVEDVPEAVRGLVRRGLAKKPEQRPKDAATFLVELEAVAGAGYGPAWEEDGRGALARRAALLLLLFPLAGAAAGGTGLAQTVLGWSKRSLNLVLAGGLAVVLAAGGGYFWYQSAQHNETLPPFIDTSPTPTSSVAGVSVTPSPSPTASPTPSPSASPTPSPSTKPPSPKPSITTSPPTTPRVISWSAPKPGVASDFCWIYKTQCDPYPETSMAKVRVVVNTATGGAFTLRLKFEQVYKPEGGAEIVDPTAPASIEPSPINVPAGGTTRVVEVPLIDLGRYWGTCRWEYESPRIRLIVSANIPGPTSTVYIADKICPVIR